jgi:hypothetical protein
MLTLKTDLEHKPTLIGVRQMAARVIHFGPDDCHRVMVLRSAGYAVDNCNSLIQLRSSLLTGCAPNAVLVSDGEGVAPEMAIAVAKSHSAAPVVLFRSTSLSYQDSGFDLVVHSLTPPEVWLNQVDAVIARSLVLCAESQGLVEKSRQLRRESAVSVVRSRAEREQSVQERVRGAGVPGRNSNPSGWPQT